VISVAAQPSTHHWSTISFASTLYLKPVLDLLLAEIPEGILPELQLGLQEALVNAAKHGNNLDPSKVILVRYSMVQGQFWWVISDQGSGFQPPSFYCLPSPECLPDTDCESGRGLYILYQVFDQVYWNSQGTELSLCKHVQAC
jgi:serine/threonine-protein kinase RsbW